MSLRNNVFLLFSALLTILVGSQWLIMRSVTQELSKELGQVAFSVAKDTATYFVVGNNSWTQRVILDELTKVEKQPQAKLQSVFVAQPSAIEIRMKNQRTDNFLQLITESGIQQIPINRDGLNNMVETLEQKMLIGTLLILALGLLTAAYFSHKLSAPLKKLSDATQLVAKGKLGVTINNMRLKSNTEIRQLIESFNKMSIQLAEIDILKSKLHENEHYKELGEIARGLAHSIRNPLNTLGLTLEELARDDLSEAKKNTMILSSERQISRVDQWIRSFMTFSLSSEMKSKDSKLLPIIHDIQLEQLNSNKNIKFEVDVNDQLFIHGVEAEIRTILHSIITNAVEASPEFGMIKIESKSTNEKVNICVYDQGNGIPSEVKNKLFQPHFSTKSKGSGMGLYMAYRLVKVRYDGDLSLSSVNGNKTDSEQSQGSYNTVVELILSKNRVVTYVE